MNLIPQEENLEQSNALDQTTTTPSAPEATTTPEIPAETTPELETAPVTSPQASTSETDAAPSATEETTDAPVATQDSVEEETMSSDPATELPSEEELQYQALLNKSDADIAKMSCAQITDDVVLLLQSGELPPRSIIDRYKSVFYSKMNSYLNTVSEENAKLRADAEAQEIRLKD